MLTLRSSVCARKNEWPRKCHPSVGPLAPGNPARKVVSVASMIEKRSLLINRRFADSMINFPPKENGAAARSGPGGFERRVRAAASRAGSRGADDPEPGALHAVPFFAPPGARSVSPRSDPVQDRSASLFQKRVPTYRARAAAATSLGTALASSRARARGMKFEVDPVSAPPGALHAVSVFTLPATSGGAGSDTVAARVAPRTGPHRGCSTTHVPATMQCRPM